VAETAALLGGSHEVGIEQVQADTRCRLQLNALRAPAGLNGVDYLLGLLHHLIVNPARKPVSSHHNRPLGGGHLKEKEFQSFPRHKLTRWLRRRQTLSWGKQHVLKGPRWIAVAAYATVILGTHNERAAIGIGKSCRVPSDLVAHLSTVTRTAIVWRPVPKRLTVEILPFGLLEKA
jgi:hypothetical protein